MKNLEVVSIEIESDENIENALRKFSKVFGKKKGKIYISDKKQGQLIFSENINFINLEVAN